MVYASALACMCAQPVLPHPTPGHPQLRSLQHDASQEDEEWQGEGCRHPANRDDCRPGLRLPCRPVCQHQQGEQARIAAAPGGCQGEACHEHAQRGKPQRGGLWEGRGVRGRQGRRPAAWSCQGADCPGSPARLLAGPGAAPGTGGGQPLSWPTHRHLQGCTGLYRAFRIPGMSQTSPWKRQSGTRLQQLCALLTMASRQFRASRSTALRPATTRGSPLIAAMITAGPRGRREGLAPWLCTVQEAGGQAAGSAAPARSLLGARGS